MINLIKIQWQIQGGSMDLMGVDGLLRQLCFKNFVSKESEPLGGALAGHAPL